MVAVLAAAPSPPGSLQPVTLASNVTAGPLVSGIGGAEAAIIGATNPGALLTYVNASLQSALSSQPEGQRVQLTITGWSLPLIGPVASQVASQVNAAWQQGQVNYGGEAVYAWPEYPGQVAWGSGDALTIRVEVAQWQALLFVFLGALAIAAVWVLWDQWSTGGTSWAAKAFQAVAQGAKSLGNLSTFVVANLWWELPVVGLAAASPWLYGHYVALREERIQLRRYEAGGVT